MRLGFKIAIRFLRSNLGQTILIVIGITIAVAVQIFIGSLIQGLQKSLVDKTIGSSSQITVSSDSNNKEIGDYQDIINTITSKETQVKYISAVSDHSALYKEDGDTKSLLVRGMDLAKSEGIYKWKENLVFGKLPSKKNEILIGVDLKKEYGWKLGDTVKLLTADQKEFKCKIVGFFDLRVSSLNSSWGIVTLPSAQKMFSTGDKVTSIEMQVNENVVFSADKIASDILGKIDGKKLKVDNWKAQNEQLLSGLQGQSVSSIMIQAFVLISVVLGISSVLAITVMQKSRQIGILKAMGLKNSAASFVFLSEGIILGIFGAVCGILLGFGLSAAFSAFVLNPDGTPVVALYLDRNFLIFSGIIALAASMVAALIPARKSTKLNPIDIIRNN